MLIDLSKLINNKDKVNHEKYILVNIFNSCHKCHFSIQDSRYSNQTAIQQRLLDIFLKLK